MTFLELQQAFNAWKASVSEEVFDSKNYDAPAGKSDATAILYRGKFDDVNAYLIADQYSKIPPGPDRGSPNIRPSPTCRI